MLFTKSYWLLLIFLVGLFSFVTPAAPAQHSSNSNEIQPRTSSQARIARGKYLVEGVAMCGTCHTPHLTNGELDQNRWLEGAALWLDPARPDSNWPLKAPRIAGNPSGGDDELISLLTTGLWRGGQRLRPPMPQFRMSREDAE